MGNIGPDITPEELRKQHADAIQIIAEQRAEIEGLTYKVRRFKELHESSMRIVRRYQAERESLLAHVEAALLGIASASSPD